VSPVSWLVADDVKKGREHLNFSEWGIYTHGRQIAKLEMISSEIDKGRMPMAKYLLLHSNATLSEADKDLLCSWAEGASDSLTALGR